MDDDVKLHGLGGANSSEGMQGYVDVVLIIILVEGQQIDTLHHALADMIPCKFLKAVEA